MATATRTVTHGTFSIERRYPVPPERVFAAFADPARKLAWFTGERDMDKGGFDMDSRIGGKERTRSVIKDGPFKGTPLTNDTFYLNILPDRRIVFVYTMSLGEKRISASLATVELIQVDGGTELVFTDQGAYFEGADGLQMREAGWRKLLEQLGNELARS